MTSTRLFQFLFLLLAGTAAAGGGAYVWYIRPERTGAATERHAAATPPAPDRSDARLAGPAGANPGSAPQAAAPAPKAQSPAASSAADTADRLPAFDIARIEPSGDAVIAGRAAPGAAVELLRDGVVHGRAVADQAGEFVLVPAPLPAGSYDLTLRSTPPGGRAATSKESVAVAIAPDHKERPVVALTAPGQPTVVLSTPAVPEASGPAVAIDAVETEAGGRLHVTGRAATGSTVRLYLNDAYLAQATAAEGRVAFSIAGGVGPGDYRVRLDAIDAASGGVRSRAEVPFNVPAVIVAAPAPSQASGPAAAAGAGQSSAPAPQPSANAPSGTSPAAAPQVSSQTSTEPMVTASTGSPPSAVVVPKIATATVSRGDNLWRISRTAYGRGVRYSIIYEANHDQIRNPNRIYPGQVFVLPAQTP